MQNHRDFLLEILILIFRIYWNYIEKIVYIFLSAFGGKCMTNLNSRKTEKIFAYWYDDESTFQCWPMYYRRFKKLLKKKSANIWTGT